VDVDPRDFAAEADAPWPVRRGGWVLRLYEHSLGLAFILLFLVSWVGHALGGFAEYAADQAEHGQVRPTLADYMVSARFWFESLQNWQSNFWRLRRWCGWRSIYANGGLPNRSRCTQRTTRPDAGRLHRRRTLTAL
jgi:hypothetical protein